MSTDEYVPSEDEMRHAYWLTRMLDHHAAVDDAFDRFLARVRRDAAREALDGLADEAVHVNWEMDGPSFALRVRRFKNRKYPEETPATEQQTDQQEAELDSWMTRTYEAEGKLWKAEARISAVDAELLYADLHGNDQVWTHDIRRALEG